MALMTVVMYLSKKISLNQGVNTNKVTLSCHNAVKTPYDVDFHAGS